MLSFEQVSEIVKLIALVAAGFWAAWTFHKLQKVRAAELENNATLNDIEKSRLEQEVTRTQLLRQQPSLAVQLHLSEMGSSTESYRSLLCVTATLKNEGDQNLRIDFEPPTLTIGRMVFDAKRKQSMDVRRFGPSYFVPGTDDPEMLTYRLLKVGQQRQMVLAAIPIKEPGCYVVQFNAAYYKIPFDGQKPTGEEPLTINAMEQAVYFVEEKHQVSGAKEPSTRGHDT